MVGIASCAGALYAYVQQARESALRTSCKCTLNQIGLALHTYHDAYGSFPPAFVRGPDGRPWHSWRVLILPYLDSGRDFIRITVSPNRGTDPIISNCSAPAEYFRLPDTTRTSRCEQPAAHLIRGSWACGSGWGRSGVTTSFAAAFGSDCDFRGSEPVTVKEIADGATSTVMIGEVIRCPGFRGRSQRISKCACIHGSEIRLDSAPAVVMEGRSSSMQMGHHGGSNRTLHNRRSTLCTRDGGESGGDY